MAQLRIRLNRGRYRFTAEAKRWGKKLWRIDGQEIKHNIAERSEWNTIKKINKCTGIVLWKMQNSLLVGLILFLWRDDCIENKHVSPNWRVRWRILNFQKECRLGLTAIIASHEWNVTVVLVMTDISCRTSLVAKKRCRGHVVSGQAGRSVTSCWEDGGPFYGWPELQSNQCSTETSGVAEEMENQRNSTGVDGQIEQED